MRQAPSPVTGADLSNALGELLGECLPSMDHIAILLHLRAAGGAHAVAGVAAETRLAPAVAQLVLEQLCGAQLVECTEGLYRFSVPGKLLPIIAELDDFNQRRPVTLVRAVYSRSTMDPAQRFADAFRLRKKD